MAENQEKTKQFMLSINETWAKVIDEIIEKCPEMNFKSKAEVIRYCLRQELPRLQEKFKNKEVE